MIRIRRRGRVDLLHHAISDHRMQEDFQQFFYYRAQSQTVFDTVCVTLTRPTVGHQFNLTGTVPAMLPTVLLYQSDSKLTPSGFNLKFVLWHAS